MADVSRVRINNNEYLVKDSQARNAITELQNNQVTSMQNLSLKTIVPSTASFPSLSIGDTGKVIFGKINKWFSDIRSALAEKLNISNIYNKLDQSKSGYVLDARQGKILNNLIAQQAEALNTAIENRVGYRNLNIAYGDLRGWIHTYLQSGNHPWITFVKYTGRGWKDCPLNTAYGTLVIFCRDFSSYGAFVLLYANSVYKAWWNVIKHDGTWGSLTWKEL